MTCMTWFALMNLESVEIWVSRGRKVVLGCKKRIFHSIWRVVICWKNENRRHKLWEYSNEKYKVTKIIRNYVKQCSYHKWYWKLRSKSFKCCIQFNIILHVICMSFVCHSYVLVWHPYITLMYSYVTRMSLACTRMSSLCHPSVVLPRTNSKCINHVRFSRISTAQKMRFSIKNVSSKCDQVRRRLN